ncbi:hypothetical protein CVT25_005936 [Psilocybe cyanescens]|uniref:Glucose-methanol-choline oxidoreductase C-terminal domain-containing protein n=1 Tax=Psilocybe cyanescens TaxID=93625 RepID=A0A409VSU1_PSICY|nr:hypothetical protein CVT25_005936 [Psilocybe cyanescens]
MDSYASTFAMIVNYRPSYTAYHSSTPSAAFGGIQARLSTAQAQATQSDWNRDDYSNHPCRLLRITGARKATHNAPNTDTTHPLSHLSNVTKSLPTPNATILGSYPSIPPLVPQHLRGPSVLSGAVDTRDRAADGKKDGNTQDVCRLLRILGTRRTDDSAPKTSDIIPLPPTGISNATKPINIHAPIARRPMAYASFGFSACVPHYAPAPICEGKTWGSSVHGATAVSCASMVTHAPQPQRSFVTASFLLDDEYASNGDAQSWAAFRGQDAMYGAVDSPDPIPSAHQASREPTNCQPRLEEAALLSTSLLLSVERSGDETYPLLSSLTISLLRSPTPDYSSSTSAYHVFLSQAVPRASLRNGLRSASQLQPASTSSSTSSSRGSLHPSTPSLLSPTSDNSSPSSVQSSSSLVLTPLASTEDLQAYTQHMASQILSVRNPEEIISSRWLVAMEEEFKRDNDEWLRAILVKDRATDAKKLIYLTTLAVEQQRSKLATGGSNFQAPSQQHLTPVEIYPGASVATDDDIVAHTVTGTRPSTAHGCGTSGIAPRDQAVVVSPSLTVYGVTSLSVGDVSIIPIIPATHTCATVYAVAEKAADLIKSRYDSSIPPAGSPPPTCSVPKYG